MDLEKIMLVTRVEQAMKARRYALRKRRIGDRIGYLTYMDEARFYLRLAREWKRKDGAYILRELRQCRGGDEEKTSVSMAVHKAQAA